MKLKRLSIALTVVLVITFSITAEAKENPSGSQIYLRSSIIGITPFADKIVVKYRINNKKYQYRRWNESRKRWVDPYWINL